MRCCTGLLLLAALSAASVQDVMKRKSARFRRALEDQGPLFGDNLNLEWKNFGHWLPSGAVSIYNSYMDRTDYICKYKCEPGYYNPDLGRYCHYPDGYYEAKADDFEILVNKDNFELLEWKEGTYGSAPQHSVRTCANEEVFVGKNKYGLGKVVPKFERFYLPYGGYQYAYKDHQVLTINRDTYTQEISDVRYAFNKVAHFQNEPEIMQTMSATNNECQTSTQSVELNQERSSETTWSVHQAVRLSIRTTFTAKVPFVAEGEYELGAESTTDFHYGRTIVESHSYKVTAKLDVPPNHFCGVRMEGRRFRTRIPFTARLSRTYANGETMWTTITGTYSKVSMGEVRCVVDRCEPVPNARPCHRSIGSAHEHGSGVFRIFDRSLED